MILISRIISARRNLFCLRFRVVRLWAPRHVKDEETFDTDSRLFIEPNNTRMPESAAIARQRAVMLHSTHNGNVKAAV